MNNKVAVILVITATVVGLLEVAGTLCRQQLKIERLEMELKQSRPLGDFNPASVKTFC